MTGVVVALGGRAAQTSRGLSVKNFVKKGCRYMHTLKIMAKFCLSVIRGGVHLKFYVVHIEQSSLSIPLNSTL